MSEQTDPIVIALQDQVDALQSVPVYGANVSLFIPPIGMNPSEHIYLMPEVQIIDDDQSSAEIVTEWAAVVTAHPSQLMYRAIAAQTAMRAALLNESCRTSLVSRGSIERRETGTNYAEAHIIVRTIVHDDYIE